MKWLFRLGCLSCISLMLSLATVGCGGSGDVGKSCELTLEASKASLKKASANGEDARIIERTFECEFAFCIANFADPKNPDKGYCTQICKTVSDCPDSTNYKCEPYVQVEKLPREFASLSQLVGEKLCLKIPPSQQPQGNKQ